MGHAYSTASGLLEPVMYGLPRDFDGDAFIGESVTAITFTENTASFNFESDLLVTTESVYNYRPSSDEALITERVPASQTGVIAMIGRSVVGTSVDQGKNLLLHFGHGGQVGFIDDSDRYESYMIKIGKREIIV